jgi:nucleotide-binding universal stress UspA family protein
MSSIDIQAHDPRSSGPRAPIRRLLFVVDAAVAGADELPPQVRAVIDAAAQVYVITPTLPGRLDWLTDEVDRFRHLADERLDTVLGHLRALNPHATGDAPRGSLLTVIADGVEVFDPDHVLLASRSPEDANWQERRLAERIEERFGLPVTSYAVDAEGHTPRADGPLILCYDGSADARHAIKRAGALFADGEAVVVTVWQPVSALGSFGWLGTPLGMVDFYELDRAAAEACVRTADAGVRIAEAAGLQAEPAAVEAAGPIWKAIVETADRQDAAAIVMGSRGLTGLRSVVLGSVSSAVLRHADRPTLVVRRSEADTDDDLRREAAAQA